MPGISIIIGTFSILINSALNINMKKYLKDLTVRHAVRLRDDYIQLNLTDDAAPLPDMLPGQFVEVLVNGSPETFLRRPISINFVDSKSNELWLLIHGIGAGTRRLLEAREGDRLSCLFPLGNGFSMPAEPGRYLLVGGGVGTAPLLYYGSRLKESGSDVTFLLGGRSKRDLLQLELFERYGRLCLTTEDGTAGTKGFVTNHDVFGESFSGIATCGPKPMMKAVAQLAQGKGTPCEASLENLMACGLGACLCCVEKNKEGHNVCVCKEGPVFNVNQLQWLISK